MRKMEWNVYINEFNERQIKKYNIFDNSGFANEVKQAYKKYKNDYEKFCEEVRRSLMYYFWCKCEWEIVLSDFPPSRTFKPAKVDVYSQVMLNKDVFMKYVWEMAHARKTKEDSK